MSAPAASTCYYDELFLDDSSSHWCVAECDCDNDRCGCSRSANEAIEFVAGFCGPFDDYIIVERVNGRVEQTEYDGPWFHEADGEGDLSMWKVEAQ